MRVDGEVAGSFCTFVSISLYFPVLGVGGEMHGLICLGNTVLPVPGVLWPYSQSLISLTTLEGGVVFVLMWKNSRAPSVIF